LISISHGFVLEVLKLPETARPTTIISYQMTVHQCVSVKTDGMAQRYLDASLVKLVITVSEERKCNVKTTSTRLKQRRKIAFHVLAPGIKMDRQVYVELENNCLSVFVAILQVRTNH
jgi:hypothetical protein